MGLTWIDHDTIEKPIEEITLKKEDVGFEFTVETLKSNANSEQASQVKKKIANKVRLLTNNETQNQQNGLIISKAVEIFT